MAEPSFVHLRMHSEFSVADGIVRIDDAVGQAAADGMAALALTDLSNLFGMVKFFMAARGMGVKPIIGCDVWVSNPTERDKSARVLLLCQSRAGYLHFPSCSPPPGQSTPRRAEITCMEQTRRHQAIRLSVPAGRRRSGLAIMPQASAWLRPTGVSAATTSSAALAIPPSSLSRRSPACGRGAARGGYARRAVHAPG
jgi:hypothetical protein